MILVFCTTIKMRKIIYIFIAVVMIAVMASCGSSKGVTYMTNIDSISLTPSKGLYDAKIMPKDLLTIGVYTVNPNASAPFNIDGQQGTGSTTTSTTKGGYLVSNDGFITFPIVGKVHVAGLTKNECEDLLKSKVQPYLARTENPDSGELQARHGLKEFGKGVSTVAKREWKTLGEATRKVGQSGKKFFKKLGKGISDSFKKDSVATK